MRAHSLAWANLKPWFSYVVGTLMLSIVFHFFLKYFSSIWNNFLSFWITSFSVELLIKNSVSFLPSFLPSFHIHSEDRPYTIKRTMCKLGKESLLEIKCYWMLDIGLSVIYNYCKVFLLKLYSLQHFIIYSEHSNKFNIHKSKTIRNTSVVKWNSRVYLWSRLTLSARLSLGLSLPQANRENLNQ
jgi:hypothetical protein